MGIFGWDYPPGCSGPPEQEDEWTESAENEPDEYRDLTDGIYDGRDGEFDEADREWAEALATEMGGEDLC